MIGMVCVRLVRGTSERCLVGAGGAGSHAHARLTDYNDYLSSTLSVPFQLHKRLATPLCWVCLRCSFAHHVAMLGSIKLLPDWSLAAYLSFSQGGLRW